MRFPVSRSQQGMWFLDQLSPGEPTFHIPYAVSLDGPLDADALPRTGSGKMDRRALPEPNWGAVTGQAPVAPRTPTEARLTAIFAEVLSLPAPVGVNDSFFALGGHSLIAVRLLARIRSAYGGNLPLRTLFADPTAAGVAAALAAADSRVADTLGDRR